MKKYILLLLVVIAFSGCYSFNGASTDGIKTVNIELFENNAPLVVSNLSNRFTESLKERIRNQSKLNIVEGDADVKLSGNIIGYDIKPIAIQDNANPIAGANRLTITVNVKYTVNVDSKTSKSFEESFSAFEDFSLAGQTLQSQEERLIRLVNAKLTENIFNRAFAQW
jgi:hypothetical protein